MNFKSTRQSGVMLCFALALALCGCATSPSGPHTDLMRAAESGNAKEVSRLLADGADVNAKDKNGNTPLHAAAHQGDRDVAELLIAKGAEIGARGIDEITPLYEAARQNHPEVAGLLIAKGADVNARTKSGYTPLQIAAENGNPDVAKVLLDHGADVNAKDKKEGATPLLWAFKSLNYAYTLKSSSPSALQIRKSLSLSGARLEQEREVLRHVKGQWHEVALLLINHGVDVNVDIVDITGDTPLGVAAIVGDKGLAEALIDKGADVNGKRGANETPLHAAIAEKHRDVAELLINKGANVNARNMSQRTPLHFLASFTDDRELAELMIAKGADVNAMDKDGRTPLAYAKGNGHGAVAEVLRQHGGK
jgi:cytohesin